MSMPQTQAARQLGRGDRLGAVATAKVQHAAAGEHVADVAAEESLELGGALRA